MNNDERILIVDDEEGLLDLLTTVLKKERFYNIHTAMNSTDALELVKTNDYDLMILDVMLPDFSGFDLSKEIRNHTTSPIIFLTARDSDFDMLTGFTLGGDDYITKPFKVLELIARINAILRRQKLTEKPISKKSTSNKFVYDTFSFDLDKGKLIVYSEDVEIAGIEFKLLQFFCENPNQVFTTEQMYESVWQEDFFGDDKTVTMHISKLRKKLNDNPKSPTIIITLRGIGYKFVPPKGV